MMASGGRFSFYLYIHYRGWDVWNGNLFFKASD